MDTPTEETGFCENSETVSANDKKSLKNIISNLSEEYCINSSVHGVRYLREKGRTWYERLFWLIMLITATASCYYLTYETWTKWVNSPVIVSLSEVSTPVWDIPFPAITFCPLVKSKRSRIAFDETYYKIQEKSFVPPETFQLFEALLEICTVDEELKLNESMLDDSYDYLKVLSDLSPDANETFEQIKWRSDIISLDHNFQDVTTDDGSCFSFNNFHLHDILRYQDLEHPGETRNIHWNIDTGYVKVFEIDTYPLRVYDGDMSEGYEFLLQSNEIDEDDVCNGNERGYKVVLSTPGDFPKTKKNFFLLPHNQALHVEIRPSMVKTDEKLRYYTPQQRQCYFSDERYLRFFKLYTENNCEIECLANYTYKTCGCVKFFMPKLENTRICGYDDIKCYKALKQKIVESGILEQECNCLPSCQSISYNVEVSQAKLDIAKLNESLINSSDYFANKTFSKISLYFSDNHFTSSKRSELYGVTDLIANCGGIFGLFMGISILSVFEMIYFATIRLHLTLKEEKRQSKLKK